MKRKNQILGITSILLSAVAFIMISRMAAAFSLAPKDPGPRLYPSISAGLIGIFGIAVLLDREETKEFLQKNQFVPAVWNFCGLCHWNLFFGLFVSVGSDAVRNMHTVCRRKEGASVDTGRVRGGFRNCGYICIPVCFFRADA